MKEIELTKGRIALVDDGDFEMLNQFKWCAHGSGKNRKFVYAVSRINKKLVRMHRLIMNPTKEQLIDHRDHNTLNNQKSNLRVCNKAENSRYRHKQSKVNKYKGVSWCNTYKKWIARIKCNNKIIHVGYFLDETEAAIAYNNAAIKYHKEFAKLNKIEN